MDDETYYKELMLKKDIKYRDAEEAVQMKIYMMLDQRYNLALLKAGNHPNKKLQIKYDTTIEAERHVCTDKEFTILTNYMFLSVCPPDNTPLDVLHKAIIKYLKKIKILEYLYVIEQRGETEDEIGKGLHAHILIYHTYDRYSKLKTEFYNTFKNIIDIHHNATSKWLNIKHNNTEQDALKRIEYMIGLKKDEVKHKKQEMDKIYRKKFNIEQYYGNMKIQPLPENI